MLSNALSIRNLERKQVLNKLLIVKQKKIIHQFITRQNMMRQHMIRLKQEQNNSKPISHHEENLGGKPNNGEPEIIEENHNIKKNKLNSLGKVIKIGRISVF